MEIEFSVFSRGKMILKYKGKSMHILGEGIISEQPTFYAYINSMNKWEPPFENILITEEEKQEIIKLVTAKSKNDKVKIVFE